MPLHQQNTADFDHHIGIGIGRNGMSNDIGSLVKEYHAFYEVSPYYVVFDGSRSERLSTMARRIQAGFDVDIYGVNPHNTVEMPPPDDYALGYVNLQKIAEEISHHSSGDSCTLDVIPFASTVFFDVRHQGKLEAMIRIRISHCGDLDQPAGVAEQRALEEVEKQLKNRGIVRR
jgi:hypothetical protein